MTNLVAWELGISEAHLLPVKSRLPGIIYDHVLFFQFLTYGNTNMTEQAQPWPLHTKSEAARDCLVC